jgi:hypothetical protein
MGRLSLLERRRRNCSGQASRKVKPGGPPDSGDQRTSSRTIIFERPFQIGREPEVYAAGSYQVETREQALSAGAYTGHLRISTVLIIPTRGGSISREVNGNELDRALVRDAQGAALGQLT